MYYLILPIMNIPARPPSQNYQVFFVIITIIVPCNVSDLLKISSSLFPSAQYSEPSELLSLELFFVSYPVHLSLICGVPSAL